MGKKTPVTAAIRALRSAKVNYQTFEYTYVEKGGTHASSQALGVSENVVIKTLVFEDDQGKPWMILMHGDCSVSSGAMARAAGVRSMKPARPEKAEKWTGYQVGGTSPFGVRKAIPLLVEKSILRLDSVWVNGGKRGFLVSLDPTIFTTVLDGTPVQVAVL